MMSQVSGESMKPLVIFDTNILFDLFLKRRGASESTEEKHTYSELISLFSMSGKQIDFRIPEFVLMEFRGSIFRELARKEEAIKQVQVIAKELNRSDQWMSAVEPFDQGCRVLKKDIDKLRGRVDVFLTIVRRMFGVEPHSSDIHYKGDLRFVQGLPPDEPLRGIQDCRIFEAVLDIGRKDAPNRRPARYFLTSDSDFLSKSKLPQLQEELNAFHIELIDKPRAIFGRYYRSVPVE